MSLPKQLNLQFFTILFSWLNSRRVKGTTGKNEDEGYITNKSHLYWTGKSLTQIIGEADALFEQGNFLGVYEMLNRLKYGSSVEVQWRIGRALFKMSRDEKVSDVHREEMIREAYDIMSEAVNNANNNANVYKWTAIITDAKKGLDGVEHRARSFELVKSYLVHAVELDPKDSVSLYMLGKWCFELSKLSLIERLISRLFYGKLPQSSYDEAYNYLIRSHEVLPEAYYIPRMYMLGETCFQLNQYFRARYFLNSAATLPARTPYESECAVKARKLLKKLDIYDLSRASFTNMDN